jgi:hypothetical protein
VTTTDTGSLAAPEAGGHPAKLLTTAAEAVRAANHATIDRRPMPGLAAGADACDTLGAELRGAAESLTVAGNRLG